MTQNSYRFISFFNLVYFAILTFQDFARKFLHRCMIVGSHNNAAARSGESVHKCKNFSCGLWVEVAGGLVSKDEVGRVE